MIARAGGDKTAAGEFINRALALNPQFDVLQATSARQILENLSR
jgi:hypothetical protein